MENHDDTSLPKRELPQGSQSSLQQEKLFLLEKKDTVFAICTALSCIVTSAFGLFGGFSLGFALSCVLSITLFAVYFSGGCKVGTFPVACGVLALLLSSVFVCTTNGSVRFCSTIMIVLLSLVCFDGLLHGDAKGNRRTLEIFFTAVATINMIALAVKSLFSNENGNKKTVGKVLVGVLCAVPVLAIVVPLFLSSYDAFL